MKVISAALDKNLSGIRECCGRAMRPGRPLALVFLQIRQSAG